MNSADIIALVVAICLVPIGGLLACVDSALARISVARVEEYLREEHRGAKALSVIMGDRARYTNLLLLLRVVCELTATVLAAIVARSQSREPFEWTFRDLRERVAGARGELQRLGVGRGDRVVAYLPNVPETVDGFLAGQMLGAAGPILLAFVVVVRDGRVVPDSRRVAAPEPTAVA